MIKFLQKHRGTRGSVTILMLIIMLPMMVFSFSLLDICKIFMAQDVAREATQLSVNAGMTSFDKVLKDMYGILATSKDEDELAKKMSKYYSATLASTGFSNETGSEVTDLIMDWIQGMTVAGESLPVDVIDTSIFENNDSYLRVNPEAGEGSNAVSVKTYASSAASNPAVMERQIVEYMKYRGPMNMAEGMLEKIGALKDLPKQAAVTNSRIEYEKTLSHINNSAIIAYTLFQIYFYNNKIAEEQTPDLGDSINLTEHKDRVDKYKYAKTSGVDCTLKASTLFSGSDGVYSKIEHNLKEASLFTIVYSPFYDFSSTPSYHTENVSEDGAELASLLLDAKDEVDRSKSNTMYGSASEGNGIKYTQVVSTLNKWENKINNYSFCSGSKWNANDAQKNAGEMYELMLALYAVSNLCRKPSDQIGVHDSNSISYFTDFLSAYDEALEQYEDLKDSQSDDDDDSSEASSEDTSDFDALEGAVSDCEDLYDEITKCISKANKIAGDLKKRADYFYSKAASQASEAYRFTQKQISIIDFLNDKDTTEGSLDSVVKQFEQAVEDAKLYSDSIEEVEQENQQNDMRSTFEHEGGQTFLGMVSGDDDTLQKIKETVQGLKDELKREKEFYEKLSTALQELTVLGEYGDSSIGGKAFKVSSDILTVSNNSMKDYCSSKMVTESYAVKSKSNFTGGFLNLTGDDKTRTSSIGVDNNNWECFGDTPGKENTKITENFVYQKIKELSSPTRESKTDSSAKEEIMSNSDTGKTADQFGQSILETSKENASSEGSSDGGDSDSEDSGSAAEDSAADKEAFEKMAQQEDFTTYMNREENQAEVTEIRVTDPDYASEDSSPDSDGTSGAQAFSTDSKDNDKVASMATQNVDFFSSMMSVLSDVFESGRDAVYVTEYLTGNFSCHTTDMDGKGKRTTDVAKMERMLAGMTFGANEKESKAKNIGYGSELEYILYGNSDPTLNKAAAGGIIFGLRFVLNLIYSFTDPEITKMTFTIASGCAGWFPFAVPIVQTVLHIGLSIAESAVDLTHLMMGAAVPLYKTTTTWVCKGSNMVKAIAGEVIETVADAAIDEAADGLCGLISNMKDGANNTIDEKSKEFQDYVKAQEDELISQVKAEIMKPINNVMQELMLQAGNIENQLDTAKQSLTKEFTKIKDTAAANSTGNLLNQALVQVMNTIIEGGYIDKIANSITGESLEQLVEAMPVASSAEGYEAEKDEGNTVTGVVSHLSKAVESKIDDIFGNLGDWIKNNTSSILDQVTGKVKTAVDELADEVNKGIINTADELKEKLSNKISTSFSGHMDKTITTSKGKKATGVEHLLDMTYKDYLYIFTLIGSLVDSARDQMLQRAALLMQANCKQAGADDDYTLNEAHTFFEVTSGASTSTVFFGAVYKDGKLDMSGARKKYEFTQTVYMGY